MAAAPSTTEDLAQAVAPALEPVRATQLLPGTIETLEVTTESVAASARETLPAVEAVTQGLLEQTRSGPEPRRSATVPLSGARDETTVSDAESAAGVAPEKTASTAPGDELSTTTSAGLPVSLAPALIKRDTPVASSGRAPGVLLTGSGPSGLTALPGLPGAREETTSNSGRAEASPQQPSAPPPFAPGGPLSGLASASAAAGAGALVPLLAALAAALVLAVPGLGRRLRLRLAPWPQPILQVSLEHPG